jgi:hypothetical protein
MSSRSLRIIRAGLSVVGNTYNPATQEVEIRKIKVQGQPGKKVSEAPSQQTSEV